MSTTVNIAMSKQSILRDIEANGRVPKWYTALKYELTSWDVCRALEKHLKIRGIKIDQSWQPDTRIMKLYALADNLRHKDEPSTISIVASRRMI